MSAGITRSRISPDGFTQISPFGEENPLDEKVQSDHAEVGVVNPDQRVINAWNISNPAYHCYFKYGSNPPFHNTHLFVDQPYSDTGVLESSLNAKVKDQINTLAERFVAGKVHVQVIVEGYRTFFDELANALLIRGCKDFYIESMLNQAPRDWQATWNVSGILVNTRVFQIWKQGVLTQEYGEAADNKRHCTLRLPYVYLQDRGTGRKSVVTAVHISGCASQRPTTGLEQLGTSIAKLWTEARGQADVLALGDFNAPPRYSKEDVPRELSGYDNIDFLAVPYLTHVNPMSQAASYDQIAISKATTSKGDYKVLPVTAMASATQAFVASIETSRQHHRQTQ